MAQATAPKRVFTRRRLVVLVIVVVVLLAAGGFWWWHHHRSSATTTAPLTVTASTGTIKQTVTASGTVEPTSTATLTFGSPGTVTAVDVAAGDTVTAGEALATIDPTALSAALTAAQAQYTATVAQQAQDRSAGASAVQLASDQAQIVSASASLASAKNDVASATLTSTIAGTVTSVDLAVGDVVGSGGGSAGGSGASGSGTTSDAITVATTDSFIVNATVAAAEASQVKVGLQAQLTITGDTATVYGTVQSIGLVAQTNSSGAAVFPVTIKVTGDQKGIYAGTSATASIIVKQVENVLTVTSRALQTSSSGGTYVLKMVGGKPVRTTVTIGTVYGASTEIKSGLSNGDKVEIPGVTLPAGSGTTGTGNRGGFGGGTFGGTGSFRGGTGGFGGGFGAGTAPGGQTVSK